MARRLVKEGVAGAAVHHPRPGPHADPDRFQRLPTAYPYSLMVPQSTTERLLLERLEELGGAVAAAEDGDRNRSGLPTGVTATIRRRRSHLRALRRRRRRHSQHRARTGGYRIRGRRVRRVVRAGRRQAGRRRAARRGDPVLGDGRPDRGGTASRRHPSNRRAGRRLPRGTLCAVRPADSRHPRGRGPLGRHRRHLGLAVPRFITASPTPSARAACCSPATRRTCTAPQVDRA